MADLWMKHRATITQPFLIRFLSCIYRCKGDLAYSPDEDEWIQGGPNEMWTKITFEIFEAIFHRWGCNFSSFRNFFDNLSNGIPILLRDFAWIVGISPNASCRLRGCPVILIYRLFRRKWALSSLQKVRTGVVGREQYEYGYDFQLR